MGVAVDPTHHTVYYACEEGVYSMASDGGDQTLVYSADGGALDVTVDMDRNLIFYATGEGLWEGSIEGNTDASQLAALGDMHFLYVTSVLPPTPAPTPVPTAGPSLAPTSAPSYAPIP